MLTFLILPCRWMISILFLKVSCSSGVKLLTCAVTAGARWLLFVSLFNESDVLLRENRLDGGEEFLLFRVSSRYDERSFDVLLTLLLWSIGERLRVLYFK